LANFFFDFLQELLMDWEAISFEKSVLSDIQTPRSGLKKWGATEMKHSDKTLFLMFDLLLVFTNAPVKVNPCSPIHWDFYYVNFLTTVVIAGVTVGDPVLRTGKPLSVELGPGNTKVKQHILSHTMYHVSFNLF
jgi:hypothetical protein